MKCNRIVELLLDNYGNFVLQKSMSCCNKIQYNYFIKVVGSNLPKLKQLSFGPKLYNKMNSAFPELAGNVKKKKNDNRLE